MRILGSLQPILLDICQNGYLKQPELTKQWLLTPKIPEILPDCTFKFCARIAEPLVYPGCKSGLEIDIINVLQDQLEFKV